MSELNMEFQEQGSQVWRHHSLLSVTEVELLGNQGVAKAFIINLQAALASGISFPFYSDGENRTACLLRSSFIPLVSRVRRADIASTFCFYCKM